MEATTMARTSTQPPIDIGISEDENATKAFEQVIDLYQTRWT